MPLSHRAHAFPFDGLRLELDRLITPHLVVRRSQLLGVRYDERLWADVIGRGIVEERARLAIVLEGRAAFHSNDRTIEAEAGEAVVLPSIGTFRQSGEGEHLEIDWDPAEGPWGDVSAAERIRISPTTLAAVRRASSDLATHAPHIRMDVALGALASEGLPFRGGRMLAEDPVDQALCSGIDRALCRLDEGPAMIDLERDVGRSRRTLTRRSREFHERYGLSGLKRTDWRSVRDFYRLLVGVMVMSHPKATTSTVARLLGYRSPEAFCHAFANAGLPAPGHIRRALAQL